MKKKIIITAVSVLAVLTLLTFGAGWYMVDYALKPAADAVIFDTSSLTIQEVTNKACEVIDAKKK